MMRCRVLNFSIPRHTHPDDLLTGQYLLLLSYFLGSSTKDAQSASQGSYICYGTRKRNNQIVITI